MSKYSLPFMPNNLANFRSSMVHMPAASVGGTGGTVGIGTSDTWSCFVAGTQVTMADGSKKNIEDVQIGEQLLGQDGSINTVLKYDHPMLNGRALIAFNEGKPFMTPEHPLWTRKGWKSFSATATQIQKPEIAHLMVNGDFEIGDEILMDDGSWFTIESIDVHLGEPEQQVYNFYLDGNNTYFADGYLAHNRGGDYYYDTVTTYKSVVTGSKTVTESKQVPYEVEQDLEDYKIPLCRPRFIFFKFENLRPNTAHWIFFDGREVTKWVNTSYSVDTYASLAANSILKNPGEKFVDATAFPSTDGLGGPTAASGPLYTDATGKLEGVYYLQSNTTLNFNTGTRMLSAMDISVYNKEKAFSYADIPYEAEGILDRYTKQTKYKTVTTTKTVPTYGTVAETTKVRVEGPRPAPYGGPNNRPPAGSPDFHNWMMIYGGP
jgi:hypothetical protein